ncbi:MAG: hypothetical protein HAW63_00535 [Bdellovibrionaceae bacterium]|nr:hypothetical protein [Pseudobdellovibrionaceae bacterium]
MKRCTYILLYFIAALFFTITTSASWKASVNAEFNYYLSPIQFSQLSQNITQLQPRLVYSSQHKKNASYFYADMGGIISSEFDDSHVVIPELFFLYNFSSTKVKKSQLVFGRKKINWSLLEADWNLGLLGSYVKVNPLRPQKQGLLGVFYKYQTSKILLRLFVSPVFIPNQTGAVDIADGKIHIFNRWQPFLYYNSILGKSIHYRLQDINYYNFLQQWSVGVWGQKQVNKWYFTGAYFYKPYASPYIYANVTDTLGLKNSVQVLVKAKPVMQHLAFFEVQLKQKQFSEYLSVVLDKPQKLSFVDNDKYSALADKNILALGLKYSNISTDINFGGIYTRFNILQQSLLSAGKDLRGIKNIYGYPYQSAVFLQMKQKNILFSLDTFFVKYTQIFTSKVEIFSLKYSKIIGSHTLAFGLDILGHPFSEQLEGVFASNVSNDFAYLGWSYVL